MREINLLPPARRQNLRRQRLQGTLLKFVHHFQTMLGLIAVAGIITGVILQGLIMFRSNPVEAQLPALIRQYQLRRQEINEKNTLVKEVAELGKRRVVWSSNVANVLRLLPAGTTISQMQALENPTRLIFSGTAVNRNALIIFDSRLKQLPWAAAVASPLQNLLAKDNPSYSFTIDVAVPQ